MNILHATDFHNRANTGMTFAVNDLVCQTKARLFPSDSVNLISVGESDIAPQHGVRYFETKMSKGPAGAWRYASCYSAMCEEIIKREGISVMHIHGAWMYPQFAAVRAAKRLGIPTVLTNHGLVQWAWRQPCGLGAMKKHMYLSLMRDRLFTKVTVHHAVTPMDRDSLHAFFPRTRIEIIPHFIDLAKVDVLLREVPEQKNSPYVLFLGRLHPTKGIDMLIEAFGQATIPRDWRLIIVGPQVDQPYLAQLRRLIAKNPRSSHIELRDAIWDPAEKYALMRDAWVTVLPSHTEVISLVNLESSACATPTITTHCTGITDWLEGGGILIEPALQPLTNALSQCSQWSEQERKQRGDASRRLIEKRYAATVVIPRWMELYHSLG